ncbi:hypothetical protein MAR_036026 [Mya arenaria]|uniref:Uncharacterized protein n=1 Tax=Mya arenaria TaxID=6604 RepID=A0ABY7EMA3_MYAAR|nr:hypothetical protein MAR_036026 [Mya arenaria]
MLGQPSLQPQQLLTAAWLTLLPPIILLMMQVVKEQ